MKTQGNSVIGAAIAFAPILLNSMPVSAAQIHKPAPVRLASVGTASGTHRPAITARDIQRVAAVSNNVSLDFVGADINDVLKALAMQSGSNIVSGNDVKGTITVSLTHVTLLEALDLITKLSGYQYARVGHTYVIGTPTSIRVLTGAPADTGPSVTDMISFTYSDPVELKKNVEAHYPNCMVMVGSHSLGSKTTSTSLAPTSPAASTDTAAPSDANGPAPAKPATANKNETVTGHGTGGVLTVSGTQSDIDSIRKFVKQVDDGLSGGIADATTAVLTFNYSDPGDLQTTVTERFPNTKVSVGKANGGQGTGSILIVTGTASDIEFIRALVAEDEAALSRGIADAKTQVYNIKYASADDLQSVLARLVPGLITTPGPSMGFNLKAPVTADSGGGTSSTATYGSAAAATTVSATANQATKPNTSSLLLTGTAQDITRALAVLAQVDVKPLQINYEAKITEINLNSSKDLGLSWDFGGASTRIGEMPDSANATADPTGPTLGDTGYPGKILKFGIIGRTAIANLVNVKLSALYKNGDAKLLSDPNIAAIDGQQAAVFIGDAVRYISSITQTATGPTVTTDTVNVGIKLFVTGKASNDGYITLNIHPEVSTITGFLAVPGGGSLPQVSNREATTTVRVKDGDILAIGGLISENDIKNVQKVPFFGDLPFFGNLFRNTGHTHNRNEVVIFVKVSIMKDPA